MERKIIYPIQLFIVNYIDVSFLQWMTLLICLLSTRESVGWSISPKETATN